MLKTEEQVTLEFRGHGVEAKSQVADYVFRGELLEEYCVFDYFADTYEADVGRYTELPAGDQPRGPGRLRSERVRYQNLHPRHAKRLRVIRAPGHNNLTDIVGRWFPRSDDEGVHSFYCASMLMLLNPWRNLCEDLKAINQTWEEAFEEFVATASSRAKHVLSGAQYFHECRMAADRDGEDGAEERPARCDRDVLGYVEDDDEMAAMDDEDIHFSEEGLAALKLSQVNWRELANGVHAVESARSAALFDRTDQSWSVDVNNLVASASGDALLRLELWRDQMREEVVRMNRILDEPASDDTRGGPLVQRLDPDNSHGNVGLMDPLVPEAALEAVDVENLRDDQFRAYDIVAWHLHATLEGKSPPPL